jgi:hypothetical protein
MIPDMTKAAATPSDRRLRLSAGAKAGSRMRRPSYTGSYTKKRSALPAVCGRTMLQPRGVPYLKLITLLVACLQNWQAHVQLKCQITRAND